MKKLVFLSILLIALSFLGAADGEFYAGDQSVFILPTAYTMPKGSFAVTGYEAVIPQIAYAPIDRLHLSAVGMIIPAGEIGFATIIFGAKCNYYRGKNIASAVWGSCMHNAPLITLGNVVSFGSNSGDGKGGVHLMGMLLGYLDSENLKGTMGTGGILKLSKHVNIMTELTFEPFNIKTEPSYYSEEENRYVLLIAGLRFKWKKASFDLGFMRMLGDVEQSELMRYPFVKITAIHF